jgi:hypothetical protein
MKSRCPCLMVDQGTFRAAIYFSMWESVELQSQLIFIKYFPWDCDSDVCIWNLSIRVRPNFQVWFRFFVASLVQAHRILESWKNTGYSLNHQCSIIYSPVHKRIALNFSTLLRQILYSISLIVQGDTDCLSNIELMYHILRHGTRIAGLPEEFSWVSLRSVLRKFSHTSNPVSGRDWWSQNWHCTDILC